ncbi:MAG: response regulator transcription factor [Erysipelotrichia bacterium]|nr:response regulator transcription factor [Erysipelotrichia bacterium]
MKKSIIIVDDHDIVRKGIVALIQSDLKYNVYEASTLNELEHNLSKHDIDLVLLDYRLKDISGADICRRIKKNNPDLKVIIFTAFSEKEVFNDCITSGVNGIILKSTESSIIFEAIASVLNNQTYYDQQLMQYLITRLTSNQNILTSIEENIMNYVCEGLRNQEIASEMFMSEKTIRNYLTKIFIKLEVSNRTEAAMKWKSMSK